MGGLKYPPFKVLKKEEKMLPENYLTSGKVKTPRGTFKTTSLTIQQMETEGYTRWFDPDDRRFVIMVDGQSAYAVLR